MAGKNIQYSQPFGGGVNASSRATFRLCDLKSNLIFLLRRILVFNHNVIPHKWNALRDLKEMFFERYRNKCGMTWFKKALAFTLAETLIVMGIIGVVAALTIPNLNSSTGEKEKVAKVKKIYSNLEDAIGRAVAVYGPMDEWIQNATASSEETGIISERILEFLKTSKNCTNAQNGCFVNSSIPYANDMLTAYKFILADGTSMAIEHWRDSTYFYFDIDGPNKGQNTLGKDTFSLHYNLSDATLSANDQETPDISAINSGGKDLGGSVTAWVLSYENMDYLKANSSGKCNNSNLTLNAKANPPVTSCK